MAYESQVRLVNMSTTCGVEIFFAFLRERVSNCKLQSVFCLTAVLMESRFFWVALVMVHIELHVVVCCLTRSGVVSVDFII